MAPLCRTMSMPVWLLTASTPRASKAWHSPCTGFLMISLKVSPRVPITWPPEESEQIVNTVRHNEGIVEYLVFEREGHGIQKLPHRLEMERRIEAFLREHLNLGGGG